MEKLFFVKKSAVALGVVTALAGPAGAFVPVCSGTVLKADVTTGAPDLIRSNVPTCDGRFVAGFQIVGDGSIEWYVDASKAAECFDVDVTVLPEDVSAYDMDDILDYLGDRAVDVYRRVESICYV